MLHRIVKTIAGEKERTNIQYTERSNIKMTTNSVIDWRLGKTLLKRRNKEKKNEEKIA